MKKSNKTPAKKETQTFGPGAFDWFDAHVPVGDTTLTRMGVATKGRPPVSFKVDFSEGTTKTFTHQYSVEDDSEAHTSKYVAVYWNSEDAQTVYVHCC